MARDGDARRVMRATGATYSTALNEVLRRRQLSQAKAYIMGVKAMPDWADGQPMRCVRCMAPEHGRCEV